MKTPQLITLLSLGGILFLVPRPARAHCDTLNGPVVLAAKEALEKGQVAPVLKWVKAGQEAEIRAAFAKTLKVRMQSPEAADLADLYFFETLVRVHRQGEGAPYTGLKPAGTLDPALTAADRAIAHGTITPLAADLSARLQAKLRAQFDELIERQQHRDESVAAGRAYVETYVTFIHLYERLSAEAEGPARGQVEHVH